ncbi:TonB-dependent receptor [Chryseolinea lacunae]|uniref:TonB-dependent receptor n=1 Tax=Chryseolinea lacunae TaxID=2801331 RepID=A0ABS1KR47_9BACT|nr:TonB-dependent receptor [Chryseolinea lacunae]MBL0741844.1 TonB-dependent receptor [Chryseolinea lacunae]
MFKVVMVATALLWSTGAYAQQFVIDGTVEDAKTHHALPGATLEVQELKRVAVADEFGRFTLPKVSAGDYTLAVRFLGYTVRLEKITVPTSGAVVIALEESPQLTDEVVVFATRANDKSPTTFSTVNKQAIQKQNFGQDLPMLLNWTPSVVTTSDAGTGIGYTGIRIRGSDATRINVTVNGIPYNDSESQGTYWVDIPDIASSSQSIQVQRGVGTSTNGAGAFGASINLQTNTRNDAPYASITTSGGSFGTLRNTLSLGSGLLNNHWVVDARVSKIKSDGFIDRGSSDLQSYYFSGGYYNKGTMLKAVVFGGKERTYQAWYGVPQSRLNNDEEAMLTTASNEGWNETQTQNLLNSGSRTFNPYTYKNQVDDYRQDHYQLHFSQRIGSAFTANAALHYTKGKGYYEEYKYNEKFSSYGLPAVQIGDSTIATSDIIRRRWLDNDFYGVTYSLNYDKDNLNMILGGAWNRYTGDHFGEIIWAQVSAVPTEYRYYFNNADKRDANVYLKTSYQFSNRLSGYVDLQVRKILYTTSGIENKQNALAVDVDFLFFNPKAGVTYSLSQSQQLYASFGIANREPVRDDFVDAPNGTVPKRETLNNLEVGYRKAGKNYALNVNYYLMDYSNQLVLTGKVNDVGASLRANVDKSYRTGIEVDGTIRLSDKFSWTANVTLSKNKIKNFDEVLYDYGADFDQYNEVKRTYASTDIAFSPNVIVGSGFSYRPIKNLEATWLAKYVGSQYLDNTSNKNRSINDYMVNDLRITYTIHPSFMREIGVSGLLNNFLNEKYESNGYTWGYLGGGSEYRENYYFPQAGTNFLLMLTLKF